MLQMRKFPDNDLSIIDCSRCGCPPQAHVQLVAQQEQEAGNEAFAQGEFSLALGHYSRALQEEPRNAVLLSNRAACYLGMKWWGSLFCLILLPHSSARETPERCTAQQESRVLSGHEAVGLSLLQERQVFVLTPGA